MFTFTPPPSKPKQFYFIHGFCDELKAYHKQYNAFGLKFDGHEYISIEHNSFISMKLKYIKIECIYTNITFCT